MNRRKPSQPFPFVEEMKVKVSQQRTEEEAKKQQQQQEEEEQKLQKQSEESSQMPQPQQPPQQQQSQNHSSSATDGTGSLFDCNHSLLTPPMFVPGGTGTHVPDRPSTPFPRDSDAAIQGMYNAAMFADDDENDPGNHDQVVNQCLSSYA